MLINDREVPELSGFNKEYFQGWMETYLNDQHRLLVAIKHQFDPYHVGIDWLTLDECLDHYSDIFAEYFGCMQCGTILARISDVVYEWRELFITSTPIPANPTSCRQMFAAT